LKISKITRNSIENIQFLANLLCKVCIANCNQSILKQFLYYTMNISDFDYQYASYFIHAFSIMMREKSHKEVFGFSRNFCGIDISKFSFPSDGFGFFGFIRIDSLTENLTENMIIWKFNSENEYGIELGISADKLKIYYSVEDLRKKDKNEFKPDIELIPDKWYFIELYHIRKTQFPNVVFFFFLAFLVCIFRWEIDSIWPI